jgi:DNA-binding HxlR family transcriptional regulator
MNNLIKYDKKACACAVSLDLLGDKWSILIVRDIFRGKKTFSEFLNLSDEGIASNILINRLKKLLDLGIINFRRSEIDKKVKEYYLTDRGIDLYPIICELQRWTLKNVEFEYSDNTKLWKEELKNSSIEEIVNQKQENYKDLRFKTFGF